MAEDMSASEIDARITSGLSAYATKSFVDSRDALNATPSYVDAGDATRLKQAQKNVANGVAGLGADGRVDRNQIGVSDTQRLPKGFWTPPNYGSGPVVITSGEATLFPMPVTDPGYPYRLVVMGNIDALSGNEGTAPRILVRVGSPSGPVIASGQGSPESYSYLGTDQFNRTGANLGSGWSELWVGSDSGHAEVSNGQAVYVKSGVSPSRAGLFRRTGNDATTETNYQEVDYVTTTSCDDGNDLASFLGVSARNFILGRASADLQNWCGFFLDAHDAQFGYRLNGTTNTLGSSVSCENTANTWFKGRFGTQAGERVFQLLRNNVPILTVNDTNAVTPMGTDYRGWGFGFRAGNHEVFGVPSQQAAPAFIDWITINDTVPGEDNSSFAPVYVIPESMATQAARTGATTLYVQLAETGPAGAVGGGYTYHNNLSVMAIPA
ncbi:hypothetical protein SEA_PHRAPPUCCINO_199 [Mycobacterium phage Phrappuccino]|uniref:DUF7257 domain-containing protein n=1 Tax=Mycobacterium phage Phrappuccino TaxID=2591223 RepID=A0A514DE33_9CAUD|nr:hypothetical protein KHQ87_gp199 [Mycobacterium phage Phrappuccino]QDH91874.1 hypothetical protein SEA_PHRAPPUCCINO_199 [Mycobacterium phage Phrappuccino]QIQ63340.1 hypothetical protein SEA_SETTECANDELA_224 [Mycobacterium phage Settecandela]